MVWAAERQPPTSPSGIPIRNLWYLLMYAWGLWPTTRSRWQSEVERAPTLDSLLATILMFAVRRRLCIGLGRAYVDQSQALRGIRGRVDFSRSVKGLIFQNGRAHCAFQEFLSNEPKNQIIRSTLVRMVKAGDFDPDRHEAEALRQQLRSLTRQLEGIDVIELSPLLIRRQRSDPSDNDYRMMLAICEAFLRGVMPTEFQGRATFPDLDRDALRLSQVYEVFVANFYRMHLDQWRVHVQMPIRWPTDAPSDYLPLMKPDLVLEQRGAGKILMLDTKFTPWSLVEGRFGNWRFDTSHLYQLYAYLRSQEEVSGAHRTASGVLLYPTVRQHLSEKVTLQGHSIRIETVDLSLPWQEIESRLLTIVREDGEQHEELVRWTPLSRQVSEDF